MGIIYDIWTSLNKLDEVKSSLNNFLLDRRLTSQLTEHDKSIVIAANRIIQKLEKNSIR